MAKLYRIILSAIFPILFISCSADYEGVGEDSTSKPQNEVKSIVISFPSGEASYDINTDVVFKATSDASEDITSFCEFFVNDSKITGNKFKSATAGDFTVYCKYNSIKSNTATFKVVSSGSKPIMTITSTTSGVTDGSSTSDATIDLKFTSNKSTSDFVEGDITVSGGTLSSFTGTGTTYSATFTPDGAGDKTIDIAADTFTDSSGNKNDASTQFNWTYVVATPKTFKTNVLVEDITGAWCGYCPRVAWKLKELQKITTQLIVVAAHYGNASIGRPDPFHYDKVSELKTAFGVSGYPWAILNRKGTGAAGRWGETDAEITSIAANPSKAGVAIESSISDRDLTVKIKAKFSEDFTGLKYVIYILENGLIQTQRTYGDLGYGKGTEIPAGSDRWWLVDFVHNHTLRKALTSSPLGDAISDASSKKGSVFEKTHNYTIPAAYNKDKMEIVAFVVKSDKSVLNARHSEFGKTQSFEEL